MPTTTIRFFSNKIDPETGNNKFLWEAETSKDNLPFIVEYDEGLFMRVTGNIYIDSKGPTVDYVKICGTDTIPNARDLF